MGMFRRDDGRRRRWFGTRQNIVRISTNGGANWSSYDGAGFPGPGVGRVRRTRIFAMMYPSYWRHMGWGDIAVGPNNTVHYAYAPHGSGQ